MNQQQFEEEQPSPLRSQRMTEEEAKSVIDLWQQEEIERGGLTTSPAVPDVAEGLNVTVEDVQRLLQQVRAQRKEEERRFALEQYEVELEQVRLAEEKRKLSEVQRQRAEAQRQQAEINRQQNSVSNVSLYGSENSVKRKPLSVELFLVMLACVLLIFLFIYETGKQSFPKGGDYVNCTTTDTSGRSVPCSPELESSLRGYLSSQRKSK